jgi:putative 4-mercaptohistidine N1-methyltranferase
VAEMLVPESYEDRDILNTYLLFHYGSPEEQLGNHFEEAVTDTGFIATLHRASRYPQETVSRLLDTTSLDESSCALDVGCALGRSSLELARYCQSVRGIDYSQSFVNVARAIAQGESFDCQLIEEGLRANSIKLSFNMAGELGSRVQFDQGDAVQLNLDTSYHVVHASNLLCRLSEPKRFLEQIPNLLKPNGQLLISSPYSWLKEYTSHDSWIGGTPDSDSKSALKEFLNALGLELELELEIPFLIREHSRKFQLSIAHAMRWRLRA